MPFPFARPTITKVIMVKGKGSLPFFKKQGTLSNVTYFTHILNSRSSLYSLKIFFGVGVGGWEELTVVFHGPGKEKQTLSFVVLWMLLKILTGEIMSLGLAFNTQKVVTCQGSGLLLHGLQVEEFDIR